MTDFAALFERMYAADDPYGYRTRWYEERKRAVLLACLPERTFRKTWELGCSNGELTAELATRSSCVYATDRTPRAVQLARERTSDLPNVKVVHAEHPTDWPAGNFHLIVFSEVGFYLSIVDLTKTIEGFARTLEPDGLLIASHWIRPFPDATMTGLEVHAAIDRLSGLSTVFLYRDADFVTQAWAAGLPSVAESDGIA